MQLVGQYPIIRLLHGIKMEIMKISVDSNMWLGIKVWCVLVGLLHGINVSSVALTAVLYHYLATNQCLAKRVSCQHSNTQTVTATLTHKRGDFSPHHSKEVTFAVELLCTSIFDNWMKDGAARQFRVVITKEEGYSGKLEKQVRRISIAFALWFASPHYSFLLMRRRRL